MDCTSLAELNQIWFHLDPNIIRCATDQEASDRERGFMRVSPHASDSDSDSATSSPTLQPS